MEIKKPQNKLAKARLCFSKGEKIPQFDRAV